MMWEGTTQEYECQVGIIGGYLGGWLPQLRIAHFEKIGSLPQFLPMVKHLIQQYIINKNRI